MSEFDVHALYAAAAAVPDPSATVTPVQDAPIVPPLGDAPTLDPNDPPISGHSVVPYGPVDLPLEPLERVTLDDPPVRAVKRTIPWVWIGLVATMAFGFALLTTTVLGLLLVL